MPDRFEEIAERLRAFRSERGLERFDTLKDLAAAIAIEASELQEIFLWEPVAEEQDFREAHRGEIAEELADILIHCLSFANRANIDPLLAMEEKMQKNEATNPAGVSLSRPKKRRSR